VFGQAPRRPADPDNQPGGRTAAARGRSCRGRRCRRRAGQGFGAELLVDGEGRTDTAWFAQRIAQRPTVNATRHHPAPLGSTVAATPPSPHPTTADQPAMPADLCPKVVSACLLDDGNAARDPGDAITDLTSDDSRPPTSAPRPAGRGWPVHCACRLAAWRKMLRGIFATHNHHPLRNGCGRPNQFLTLFCGRVTREVGDVLLVRRVNELPCLRTHPFATWPVPITRTQTSRLKRNAFSIPGKPSNRPWGSRDEFERVPQHPLTGHIAHPADLTETLARASSAPSPTSQPTLLLCM